MTRRLLMAAVVFAVCTPRITTLAFGQEEATISSNWNRVIVESRTSLSMSICVEPPMRRTSPIHDQLFSAIGGLNADFLHFQPWRPYTRIAVASLEPPPYVQTFW